MNIVTKLKIFGIYATSLIIILGVIIWWRSTQVNLAIEKNRVAHMLVHDTFILNTLNDDYILTENKRAEIQWIQQYKNLNKTISSYKIENSQEQRIIDELNEKKYVLLTDFSRLQNDIKQPVASSEAMRKRLAGQLSVEMQYIVFLSTNLSEINNDRLNTIRQTSSLFLFGLGVFLGISVIGTYFIIARRISKSIKKLTLGTQTFAEGNLDFRFDIKTRDEFGSLEHSFNKMAADLQTTYKHVASEKIKDEAILESIGDGLLATDSQGNIMLMNKQAETLLGLEEKNSLGKPVIETIQMEDSIGNIIPHEKRPLHQVLESGKKFTTIGTSDTYYYAHKNGHKFPTAITVTPLTIDKKTVGTIEVFRDITYEKELDHAKDEFIALASHELRTPMTAIKGLVSMILQGDYGEIHEKLKKPLTNIKISTDRETQLINDLLNISRLQMGKIKYDLTTFSIKSIILEVIDGLNSIAKPKGIEIKIETYEERVVYADANWTKQILINLIGNALKFTEKGTIFIKYHEKTDHVEIHVQDTGVGINSADEKKLFTKFQQLTAQHLSKPTGSGLGLYISREIARKMGGDVRFERSKSNVGSLFVFSVPIGKKK
jgi:PAS domain S-box-containing protein